jgi:hypothetical protein
VAIGYEFVSNGARLEALTKQNQVISISYRPGTLVAEANTFQWGMIPVSNLSGDFSNLPSRPAMSGFLERALPGRSSGIQRVRQQILEFSASPTAKNVLVRGPIGVGKSTIARLIALTKRVAPLTPMRAKEMLDLAGFDASDQTHLLQYVASWYIELPLTGLVETLAEAQLFGSAKDAYTGATNRAGVFESASRGHVPRATWFLAIFPRRGSFNLSPTRTTSVGRASHRKYRSSGSIGSLCSGNRNRISGGMHGRMRSSE